MRTFGAVQPASKTRVTCDSGWLIHRADTPIYMLKNACLGAEISLDTAANALSRSVQKLRGDPKIV